MLNLRALIASWCILAFFNKGWGMMQHASIPDIDLGLMFEKAKREKDITALYIFY